MERDFLSLSTTRSTTADANNHRSEQRGSEMQWGFSDRGSTSSQVVSFKSYPEDNLKRDGFYQVTSPGFVPASTIGNSNQRSDMQSVYHHRGLESFSVQNKQNQAIKSTKNYPILQSLTFLEEENVGGFTSKPQSSRCVSATSPASGIPNKSCFPTYTDTRISNEPSSGSAQLTIFYAGSVIVYDSVSPEKAQAIMLLARSGPSSATLRPFPNPQQLSLTKPSTQDVLCVDNPPHTSTKSGLRRPFSLAAIQCREVSKTIAMTSSQQQPDPIKAVNSRISSARYTISGPVPQARKASLARFLEKRKERVASTQPYYTDQKNSELEHNMSSAADNLSCSLRSPGC